MKVSLLPKFDNNNGWLRILPDLPEPQVVTGSLSFDYVVIGGGYGGLAAARRLGELNPGASVALVDAGRIGNNSAGRCSGFIIDHAHNIRAKSFADAPDESRKGIALNRAGLEWLAEIVQSQGISCGWRPEGKVHAAASDAGVAQLEIFAASLEAVEEDYTMMDAAELESKFGTSFYQRGLLAPHTVLVQPAELVVALARTMPANVTVFEDSPVIDVTYGPPHQLACARGTITTNTLVLTVNGFGEGFGFFSRHLLPLITWGSLTRQLTQAELERLGGEESYGIIPAHPAGTTVRRLAGGRILIRNQYTYSARSDVTVNNEAIAAVHRKSFEARYPMLSKVEFEYTWGGALSLSRNGAGVCGQLQPGVWASMVYQGTGMAKGTISGKYLAELMMGERPQLLEVLTMGSSPSRNYPEPFNRWGVRLNTRWRRHQAGVEE